MKRLLSVIGEFLAALAVIVLLLILMLLIGVGTLVVLGYLAARFTYRI